MCEIFSTIGAAILGSSAITSGLASSTTAATAVGIGATASTIGGIAGTGLSIANNIRASQENSSARKMQEALAKQTNRLNVEKTAENLKENRLSSRTLASLRIPLNSVNDSSVNTTQGNSTTGTGLNIPM